MLVLKCPKCGNKKLFHGDATVNVTISFEDDVATIANDCGNDYDISDSWITCANEACEYSEELKNFII